MSLARPVPEPVEGPDPHRLPGRSLSLSKGRTPSSTPRGTFPPIIVPPTVLQHVSGNVSCPFRSPSRAPLKHGPFPHSGLDPESPPRHSRPDRESLKTVCHEIAILRIQTRQMPLSKPGSATFQATRARFRARPFWSIQAPCHFDRAPASGEIFQHASRHVSAHYRSPTRAP